MMKKILVTLAFAGLAGAAQAQDEGKKDKPAGGVGAVPVARAEQKAVDVVKTLKDQLITVDGDEVEDAELEEGMDYYLVYHSSSW